MSLGSGCCSPWRKFKLYIVLTTYFILWRIKGDSQCPQNGFYKHKNFVTTGIRQLWNKLPFDPFRVV
jgi:hypothetical protein